MAAMGRLEEKVAIITGGGQGIGRGIALALAREGASVSLPELNVERFGEQRGTIVNEIVSPVQEP